MSELEELNPQTAWDAFHEARDRFFAQVRPEAIKSSPTVGRTRWGAAPPSGRSPVGIMLNPRPLTRVWTKWTNEAPTRPHSRVRRPS